MGADYRYRNYFARQASDPLHRHRSAVAIEAGHDRLDGIGQILADDVVQRRGAALHAGTLDSRLVSTDPARTAQTK